MSAWIKDTESDPPRVIYTPPLTGENMMPSGLTRIIFDPAAPVSQRWTAELSFLYKNAETVSNVEAGMAGDFAWQD